MEWAVASGPLQAPAGPLRISWREPASKLSWTRPCSLPRAVSVAVPLSWSEPATYDALACRMTSLTVTPPVRAFSDEAIKARACGSRSTVCGAATASLTPSEQNSSAAPNPKRNTSRTTDRIVGLYVCRNMALPPGGELTDESQARVFGGSPSTLGYRGSVGTGRSRLLKFDVAAFLPGHAVTELSKYTDDLLST